MFRFRVLAEIASPTLGDMLGTLQTAGCHVIDCQVIAETPAADPHAEERQKVVEHAAVYLPDRRSRRHGRPPGTKQGGGPTAKVRAILAEFPVGHIFRRMEVIDQLRQAGTGESSARSAWKFAMRDASHIRRRPDGTYEVRGKGKLPPQPPAGITGSSRGFVAATVAAMAPGQTITRKEIMSTGMAKGLSSKSVNVAIYEAYASRGLLVHVGVGIYRKPTLAKSTPSPSATDDAEVHIER